MICDMQHKYYESAERLNFIIETLSHLVSFTGNNQQAHTVVLNCSRFRN